jgi:ribonuclease HII
MSMSSPSPPDAAALHDLSTRQARGVSPIQHLAGMDEAGLGPILGPLVVAGIALAGPAGEDPWRLLRRVVCRRRHEKGKVRVADSKKVHQGKHRLEHVERTALTFWTAWQGELPATVGALLQGFGTDLDELRRCPWYRELETPLPLSCDRDELRLCAHLLGRELEKKRVVLQRVDAFVVDAAEFNRLIAEDDNKSTTHFRAYARVLGRLVEHLPDGANLVADRCGGRVHYVDLLRQLWPDATVTTEHESAATSAYRVDGGRGSVRVTFRERAEDCAFPTALASCVAKYLREVCLHQLNRWFRDRMPQVKPTAGYYGDGHRFVAEIEDLLAREGCPRDLLVRVR